MPTNSGLLALDEDGTACSSDYYLRLTGDGGRMLKGQIALTATRPTQPVAGGGDTSAPTVPGNLRVTGNTDTIVARLERRDGQRRRHRLPRAQLGRRSGRHDRRARVHASPGSTPSTSYTFEVTAHDAAGNISGPSNSGHGHHGAAPAHTNLALHKPTAESSHTQVYGSGNAVDGDPNTYWESANNAFPQWLQVDLGAAMATRRIVLTLPPSSAWGTRTQTLSVQGSTDGTSFSTVAGSAGYTFDPATGNTATIVFAASTTVRYLRLNFTANTGWPAGQVSEFRVFAS